jgi:hypothetical protein
MPRNGVVAGAAVLAAADGKAKNYYNCYYIETYIALPIAPNKRDFSLSEP